VQTPTKKPLGLRVPRAIFTAVLAAHRDTKAARQDAVAKKDARLTTKAEEQILLSYPKIPPSLVEELLNHTLQKRSGRVGRTGTLELEVVVRLAVGAFVRHRFTGYEALLKEGMGREKARETVREECERVMAEWKGDGKEREEGGDGGEVVERRLGRRREEQSRDGHKAVVKTRTGRRREEAVRVARARSLSVEVIDLTGC
jgi:hypothetical protein